MQKYNARLKEILKIGVPAILENLAHVLVLFIDTQMISVLGNEAISAVSLTTQPNMLFVSIFFALGTTVSVFVAQAYGKKDKAMAHNYFFSVIKIAFAISLALGILLHFLAEPIIFLFNRQAESVQLSAEFFGIIN